MTDFVRKKAYLVNVSKGDAIQIDEEEVQKVIQGVAQGQVVVVKTGIINPSYFVSIVEDKKRVGEWWNNTKYDEEARLKGIPPLKTIFTHATGLKGKLEPEKLGDGSK